MSYGIIGNTINITEGHFHIFLNSPFKKCLDFLSDESGIMLSDRNQVGVSGGYNVKLEPSELAAMSKIINKFKDKIIIDDDYHCNSSVALGLYETGSRNYNIGHKAKYYDDYNSQLAKKKMLLDFLKFMYDSNMYQNLIKENAIILSIPKNKNKKDKNDLSEWLTEQISIFYSLTNITPLLSFWKEYDLKPTKSSGEIIKKTLKQKNVILENSKLDFSDSILQYTSKKIIIIDNMHDTGATIKYITSKLREKIKPIEIHSLYYSKIKMYGAEYNEL